MIDVEETYIENRVMVQPNHANNLQTAHGGHVLKWMDEVGAMSAMRFAGNSCVTARINQVDFERPIQVGDTSLIKSYVYRAGRTSVRVRLQVYRENLRNGKQQKATESYFVYVAIDDDREPTTVPELGVSSDRGERLRDEALAGEGQ
ncbi:acyl-CoA thioesterase [Halococcus saccharolyticus]|uniref:Thioesterase superfamily protein n=1 Tax=Halococcus saccharolyticus DSM 5350 TaxID=1227455 RepID=M0MJR6_9EURY|nr:acyl-CoA thioesterase [Halococcus saccharolyticus]EMA44690.1 thioesterase superfamily protein [Halococcus saccharolyticus DSM 5350]